MNTHQNTYKHVMDETFEKLDLVFGVRDLQRVAEDGVLALEKWKWTIFAQIGLWRCIQWGRERWQWQYFLHFWSRPSCSFLSMVHNTGKMIQRLSLYDLVFFSEWWGGEGWGWLLIGMPSDWGLVLGGGQRDGQVLEGQGQGPLEGLATRPCGSERAAGEGRGWEGSLSSRWYLLTFCIFSLVFNYVSVLTLDVVANYHYYNNDIINYDRGAVGAAQH